jgi:putative Mg2+ transporter-C (MgtC) family protein
MIIFLKDALIKFAIAIFLSGLIGFERERRHRPAGFRTIMLICLGATLITTIAVTLGEVRDYMPMVAAIITGVGFLGAGAVIHNNQSTLGLTTAASIWLISCVGIAVGLGYYIDAAIITVVAYLILEVGGYLEQRFKFSDDKFILKGSRKK